jgi:hypothetical protein
VKINETPGRIIPVFFVAKKRLKIRIQTSKLRDGDELL